MFLSGRWPLRTTIRFWKKWRRLRGYRVIEKVINGVKFKDAEEVKEAQKLA